MNKKKLTKKEKIQLSEENKIISKSEEDNGSEGYVDFFRFLLFSCITITIVCFSLSLDYSDRLYNKSQKTMFSIALAPVLYSIISGFLGRNLLMEFIDIIKLIFNKDFQTNNSYQMNTLVFLLLLVESLFILIFFVDWSLFGGYMVQISATVAVIFVNSIIVITKNFFSSKTKK